ncbi:hypothetical protein D4R42_04365 [bacterium]|nr:MAG: hypothetical protein D4R42_04365 [bacterium]
MSPKPFLSIMSFFVLVSFFVSAFSVVVVFSSSENWNWVEVEIITGDTCNLYETEPFNISSSVSVWRIVWEYEPRTDVPEDRTGITIYLYAGASGDDKIFEIGRKGLYNGDEDCRYYHEEGVFRLKISSNTQNFTVRIEKSMGYIPEPPSDNWVEVTRFIGTSGFTTDVFVCDHVEWRIRWEYDPMSVLFWEGLKPLDVKVHPEGQSTLTVSSITGVGSRDGINYVHDNAGRFYMTISTTFLRNFTIIVEQNIESIPEFPSLTILGFILVDSLTIVLFKKKVWRQFS